MWFLSASVTLSIAGDNVHYVHYYDTGDLRHKPSPIPTSDYFHQYQTNHDHLGPVNVLRVNHGVHPYPSEHLYPPMVMTNGHGGGSGGFDHRRFGYQPGYGQDLVSPPGPTAAVPRFPTNGVHKSHPHRYKLGGWPLNHGRPFDDNYISRYPFRGDEQVLPFAHDAGRQPLGGASYDPTFVPLYPNEHHGHPYSP